MAELEKVQDIQCVDLIENSLAKSKIAGIVILCIMFCKSHLYISQYKMCLSVINNSVMKERFHLKVISLAFVNIMQTM